MVRRTLKYVLRNNPITTINRLLEQHGSPPNNCKGVIYTHTDIHTELLGTIPTGGAG